jgi:hypothetical protein
VTAAAENDRIETVGRRDSRSEIGTLLLVAKGYLTGIAGGRKSREAADVATLVASTPAVKNFLTLLRKSRDARLLPNPGWRKESPKVRSQ